MIYDCCISLVFFYLFYVLMLNILVNSADNLSCVDLKGGGGTGGPDPPEKLQTFRVS